ncbi:YjbF family lipoprotein [Pseudomonas sp. CCI3.1]|uniref:YjbF family lipoprotein n=1 Tax=Pseudomonas sp. CCI3.1 TaxID=3048618 RepID=UPI002AB5A10E|nr:MULTISPECIES: YjbF family lipoprotein [unclassified Pseudomonas]MDY7584989.1 YjbF family lipoprotein [Pseudomonas sp. CCI3.1]MEB0066292.1 YjbF family lipoprotein [Pseudomonas sp. CCI3.1]MEB0071610.1 YjbF family lipoprotein [Pseudomonas sp. CCI1.4]
MKTLRNRSCLVACLLLCGCSPLMKASVDTFKATLNSAEPVQLTADDVAAVPYAQILVTTPSSQGVMAKLRQQGDLQYWVASGKQVLLMRNGLVVRTTGLEPGLDGTRFDGQSPFKRGLQHIADGERSTRWIDMYQGEQVGLAVNSRFIRKGLETVTILDTPYVLQRIDEKVEIPALGFSNTNHYWVRPADGIILQSEQYVTPGLLLRIVHLRPDWEATQ